MLYYISFILVVGLSLIREISAVWCYYGFDTYYCSPGQTCGTYYGDCRGLPTYAIIAIISGGILILSVCIRCCIYLSTNKTQPIRRAAPISIGNPSNVQVRVHSTTNYRTAQTASTARVHAVTEDPPPSYTAATAFNSQPPKY